MYWGEYETYRVEGQDEQMTDSLKIGTCLTTVKISLQLFQVQY